MWSIIEIRTLGIFFCGCVIRIALKQRVFLGIIISLGFNLANGLIWMSKRRSHYIILNLCEPIPVKKPSNKVIKQKQPICRENSIK